ncbi:MAG: DUF1801 domain-containing protein [Sphingobacteriales bacterium]|jgi:uncharacterized protein YdhG (YjbR/CyaY superfamily)|nr:DUF1801 domain-containing protein [Sphingobacteriales bacterium]NCT74589.1 DUF1801 domain-containing protein [Chitinophagaceae bacterium]OJW32376.1 MAG: hypothetical protein BGO54_18435 [Sphingobacteriales bacterium 46-32]
MQSAATTVKAYLEELPADRREAINRLRQEIRKNIPEGFKEEMNYGMIGYVVPHKLYPAGYHCDPKAPLPFMSVASQKNFVAVYHMGVYSIPAINKWFVEACARAGITKLDMGKSCIRFKNLSKIPYEVIGELASKMKPEEWIAYYEKVIKRS